MCLPSHIMQFLLRTIELIPEEKEDMWHVYNLISIGDSVQASTIR